MLFALMLVVPVLVAGVGQASYHRDDGRPDGAQGDQNGSGQDGEDRGPPASAKEARQRAQAKARRAGLFAQFSYQEGHADGHFVSFNLSEDTATVSDFTLTHNGTDTLLFDQVSPDTFTGDAPARAAGSQLMLRGEDLSLQAHDNPTGLLRYTSSNGTATVTFTLADGASAGDVQNGSLVNVKAGDVAGAILLAGNGTLSAGGGAVTAELDDPGSILFRAVPLGASPEERKQARALSRTAADGKLGASVRMSGVNGTPAADVSEGEVNVTPLEASQGRARLEMAAQARQGKVVNLALDRDLVNVSTPDEAVVKLDGESVTVEPDIDAVVNATGPDARGHVFLTNSTVEVTVYVPSFSIHSLVTKSSEAVPDLPTPTGVSNPSGLAMSTAQQARQQIHDRAMAWNDLPAQVRTQAAAQARQARLFGAFELSGGQASGAFVDLQIDANAGQLSGLGVTDAGTAVPVFDTVELDPYTKAADPALTGPSLALVGQNAIAIAHDTPTGALHVKAGSDSVTVTYALSDGVSMERAGENHVKLTASGHHGHLLVAGGNGAFSLEGDQIRLALGANAQSLFVLHPSDPTATATALHERVDAIKQGSFGTSLSVAAADGQALDALQSYSVDASTTALEVGQSLTATLSSQAPGPRVVAIEVPRSLVGATASADVEVRIDGQTVDTSATAEQVLAGATSQARASVTAQADALQVLVNVPSFSDKDVTVQSTDTDAGGGGSGGTNDTGGGGSGGTGTQDSPAVGGALLVGLVSLAAGLLAVRRDR